jgi:Putative adhesin
MPNLIRRSLAVLGLNLLLGGALAASDSAQGSFERTYSVAGAIDLEVLTHSGDISVRAGPPGTVTVKGEIYIADRLWGNRRGDVVEIEKNPPIRQSGNSIHIDYLSQHGISVAYEITAPSNTALHTHSGSGNQEVGGLRGTVELETGSGDLRLSDIAGSQVRLHSGSGDIEAQEISGPFTAEAGSGNIRLGEKGEGEVRIRTGSGNIEVRGVRGPLWSESGSGDTEISGAIVGGWEIRTGSGDVDLRPPGDAAFDLDATTGSGKILTDRTVSIVVQGDLRKTEQTIRGKVAGGGPRLSVRTGSGDVRLH